MIVEAFAGLALFAAGTGMTEFGGEAARLCFEAASASVVDSDDLDTCNRALREPQLSERDRVATLVNRGILYSRLSRTDEAFADFDAALANDPDNGEAYLNKGVAWSRREEWRAAIADFDRALSLGLRRPARAYYNRGLAHARLGEVASAYRDLQRASALAPEWERPLTALSRFRVRARSP